MTTTGRERANRYHTRRTTLTPKHFIWQSTTSTLQWHAPIQTRVFLQYHQCWNSQSKYALLGLNNVLDASDAKVILSRYLAKRTTILPQFNVYCQSPCLESGTPNPNDPTLSLGQDLIYCIEASMAKSEWLSGISYHHTSGDFVQCSGKG